MRILSHPLRLDSTGAAVTVDQWSDRAAGELTGVVLSTRQGERGLAPEYGLPDMLGGDVSLDAVGDVVEECEPDVQVLDVTGTATPGGDVVMTTQARWREEQS